MWDFCTTALDVAERKQTRLVSANRSWERLLLASETQLHLVVVFVRLHASCVRSIFFQMLSCLRVPHGGRLYNGWRMWVIAPQEVQKFWFYWGNRHVSSVTYPGSHCQSLGLGPQWFPKAGVTTTGFPAHQTCLWTLLWAKEVPFPSSFLLYVQINTIQKEDAWEGLYSRRFHLAPTFRWCP